VHLRPAADDKLFDGLDVNSDGTLTLEELEGQALVIETEEDGTLEVHPPEAGDDPASTATMTSEQKQKFFKELDRNRDGTVTGPEWNRASDEGFILFRF
jgi:hypothetical protein